MISYFELLKMIENGKKPKYIKYQNSRYDLVVFDNGDFSYIWNGRDDILNRIDYKCSSIMNKQNISLPSSEEDFVKEG